LSAVRTPASNREDAAPLGSRALLRTAFAGVGLGLLLRGLLFLPLFLWARGSDAGAAALKGAVGGDLFGWAVLTLLLRPVRGAEIGLGAMLELALVGLYIQREALFEIHADVETTAITVLFFFGVLFAKTGLWAADHILRLTGVKESA
jgi:hypothetical protein